MEYNLAQVNKLSAFCTRVEALIYVEEVDEDAKGFRIEVESQQTLQNSFHNHPYIDNDVHLGVTADLVDGKFPLGEIKNIELTQSITTGPEWKLDNRVTLTNNKRTFSSPIPLRIEANGNARFAYQYWIWCHQDEGYHISSRRYSENVELRLVNRTPDGLAVYFQKDSMDSNTSYVGPGESISLATKAVLTPKSNWLINIKKATEADAKKLTRVTKVAEK